VKQSVSPTVVISLIALAVILVGVIVFRTMTAPSSVPAAGVAAGKPVPPNQGGGPTEADLKRMREYNEANPGAASSRR
jgi:hypothetical protein